MVIRSLQEIDSSLLEKKKYLEELFNINIKEVFVLILSKEDFHKLNKPSWVVGFCSPRERLICVMEEKSTGRTNEEWLKIIVHEMTHLYYVEKFGTAQPKWFFEGLACHVAEQKKIRTEVTLQDLIELFPESNTDKEIYTKGYSIIQKMLE